VHESIVLSFLPPTYIAHTVAILLHDHWAIYDPPSTSLLYAMHHTLLAITISCKGQEYHGGYWGCTGISTPLLTLPDEGVGCTCYNTGGGLAFTTYRFTSKLYCGSLSSFYCPPLPATPGLLQYYCTTFAQYTPPNRPLLCMPYTIHYLLVMAILCEGQVGGSA